MQPLMMKNEKNVFVAFCLQTWVGITWKSFLFIFAISLAKYNRQSKNIWQMSCKIYFAYFDAYHTFIINVKSRYNIILVFQLNKKIIMPTIKIIILISYYYVWKLYLKIQYEKIISWKRMWYGFYRIFLLRASN